MKAATLVLLVFLSSSALASTYVPGYTRDDGSYVPGYYITKPGNQSKSQVNPYLTDPAVESKQQDEIQKQEIEEEQEVAPYYQNTNRLHDSNWQF